MNQFRYRIYYRWDGRTGADPFAKEKSATEVEDALRQFTSDLVHRLEDREVQFSTSDVSPGSTSVELHVATVGTREQLEAALIPALESWRLYGDWLGETRNAP